MRASLAFMLPFAVFCWPATALAPSDPISQDVSRRSLAAGCAAIAAAPWLKNVAPALAAPPPGVAVRKVLVAGATGRTGRECVRALAADARYRAVPLVRSAARWRAERAPVTSSALPPSLVVEADLTDPRAADVLAPALRACDDVICAVGFRPSFANSTADRAAAAAVDRDGVIAMIEASERAPLRGRFVLVSSLLTGEVARARGGASYQLLNRLGGVVDAKRAAEVRLRASTSLKNWVILRPGVFADVAQGGVVIGPEDRFVGDDASDGFGFASRVPCKSPFFAASGAVCGVTRGQLADVCVAALSDVGAARRTFEVGAAVASLLLFVFFRSHVIRLSCARGFQVRPMHHRCEARPPPLEATHAWWFTCPFANLSGCCSFRSRWSRGQTHRHSPSRRGLRRSRAS